MKLLLDANISWRLVANLKNYFADCQHVDHIGLTSSPTDKEIWDYAFTNQFIIVSNDADFLNFVNLKNFPPKVNLLRTGNQSNAFIEKILIKHIQEISALSDSTEYGFLEIF